MNVTETLDEIIIRHAPLGKWITGGLLAFFIGGIFVWFVFSKLENRFGLFPVLLLATAIYVFTEIKIFPLMFAPRMKVTVSRKTKSVDVLSRRIYGANTKRYFFHQIEKFKSHKGKTRLAPAYTLTLVSANRKIIKLEIPIADKNSTVKFVKKLNKFIKQAGSQNKIAEPAQNPFL